MTLVIEGGTLVEGGWYVGSTTTYFRKESSESSKRNDEIACTWSYHSKRRKDSESINGGAEYATTCEAWGTFKNVLNCWRHGSILSIIQIYNLHYIALWYKARMTDKPKPAPAPRAIVLWMWPRGFGRSCNGWGSVLMAGTSCSVIPFY